MANTKLPYDTELEDCILGALIRNQEAYDSVAQYVIDKDVFSQKKSKLLWKRITESINKKKRVDLISICSDLTLTEIKGGLTKHYISNCHTQAPTKGTEEYYASRLYEKYLMRKVIIKVDDILKNAEGNYDDVYNTIADTHTLFGELLTLRPSSVQSIDDIIDDTLNSITDKTTKLISTGYGNLDKFAGGLTRGEITIIGGRPGHGKTTVLINLLSKALSNGLKAIFFSRELPNSELLKKIICLESEQLSYSMVRKNVYSEQEMTIVNQTIENIRKKYNDGMFLMFDNLRDFSQSASEVKKFKPDIIFDDYIQLIKCTGREEQRRLQIEQLVNDYKWLAKESNAAVVLASQLNRGIEYRDGKYEPQLSDLAESGAIEQVAENVFFTYYDYKVKGEAGKGKNIISMSAKKVRYGETGLVDMGYDGDKCKLYNSMEEMIDGEIPF